MYAIRAVYDGINFEPKEPIPVKEKYEVIITFTSPVNNTDNQRKKFSKTEKKKITDSLYGILPSDIDLDKLRTERLQ